MFLPRDELSGQRRQAERIGIHERVVKDHVGAAEQFRAAQREQARVARPGPDEIDRAFGFHAHSLCERRGYAISEAFNKAANFVVAGCIVLPHPGFLAKEKEKHSTVSRNSGD